MTKKLLKVQNLEASIEKKKILKKLNLEINENEIHVIMGANG
jgi:Fe-S cluster assembly ATPase SufC